MLTEFSIPKFGEWPLFGKQIDFITVSLRPIPVFHGSEKPTLKDGLTDIQKSQLSVQSHLVNFCVDSI
jgi:hypothetical protein